MAVSINKTCHGVYIWDRFVVVIIFKNLLGVCNVEAVSFDSELTAEIRLWLCNLQNFSK